VQEFQCPGTKVLLRICLASRAEVCLFLADEGELEQFKHPE
jgi:hypothetical protein